MFEYPRPQHAAIIDEKGDLFTKAGGQLPLAFLAHQRGRLVQAANPSAKLSTAGTFIAVRFCVSGTCLKSNSLGSEAWYTSGDQSARLARLGTCHRYAFTGVRYRVSRLRNGVV